MTFKRIIAFSCFLGRLYGDGFHPEELILTPGGYVTAETLRPGYSVLGVDPETGALEPCTVSALFIHHDWPAVQLHLDRGPIRCAENQLFLKSDGDWVFASELVAGNQLLCEDGRIDVVAGLSFEALPIDAIGLMVEPHHTLCVGSQGIVAHNFLPLIAVPLITWTIGAEVTFLTLSTLGVAAATAATYWGLSKASYAVNRRWEPTPSYFDTYMRNGSDDYGSGSSPGGQRSSGTSNKSDPSEPPTPRRPTPVGGRPPNQYDRDSRHGSQQRGPISPAPKDGQTALDRADADPLHPMSNKLTGYSSGQFVGFRMTSPGLYHGFVIPWSEVPFQLRQDWKAAGIVTAGGRLLDHS